VKTSGSFYYYLDDRVVVVSCRRLGTMKTGLFGEYCWVASMLSFDASKVSVTIGR